MVNTTTDRPAGLDEAIAALPVLDRMRVRLAEVLGWKWHKEAWLWSLMRPGSRVATAEYASAGLRILYGRLPDWPRDPAAWGALIDQYKVDISFYRHGMRGGDALDWITAEAHLAPRPIEVEWKGHSPGPAVTLAVIAALGGRTDDLRPEEADDAEA